MINIDNLENFVTEELSPGERFSLRKEGWIEIITRLRQAEKDAARYRWLRDEAIEHQDSGPMIIFSDFNGEPCSFGDCGSIISHDDADKAIDEAMQCK